MGVWKSFVSLCLVTGAELIFPIPGSEGTRAGRWLENL